MIRRPPRSPLFPYPPLFRSRAFRTRSGAPPQDGALRGVRGVRRALSGGADERVEDAGPWPADSVRGQPRRSEEHTSELQSPCNLVCRLLLEKKKKHIHNN